MKALRFSAVSLFLLACGPTEVPDFDAPYSDDDVEQWQEETALTYDDDGVATPDLGELNPYVLSTLAEYPTDGSYEYYWPRGDESWLGTATDVYYLDQLYAKGDEQHRSFCSGITFEVFMRAYEAWALENNVPYVISNIPDLEALDLFRRRWWGKERLDTMNHAMTSFGIGQRITTLSKVKKGDFVQLWRRDDSGHSAIFMNWVKKDGNITGLRYWSTQQTTHGIGLRTEYFGSTGHRVNLKRLRITRAGFPKT